jgi:hypothetical protein
VLLLVLVLVLVLVLLLVLVLVLVLVIVLRFPRRAAAFSCILRALPVDTGFQRRA